MSTQSPVDPSSPLWRAWEAYKATEEYKNTRYWAGITPHTEGSLWAAFEQGWRAANSGYGPTNRADVAESQLAALRAALEPIARREHERAVGASALFSVEHWKHNAGQEHPHEPDDDSFIAFENCKHPICASVRSADPSQVEPVRIGAFDYVENADRTVTRKDWRDE